MTGFPRVKLGLLAHITAGQGAPQSEAEYGAEGYPFIKAAHMQGLSCGSLLEAQCLRVSDEVAQRRKLKIYKAGSIIFAKSGMSCMKGYVHCLTQDAYLVNHLACITLTATERASAPYLKYYFLKHSPSRLVKDEGYPSISLTDISKLEIPLPPLVEQERIAAELDAVVATLKKRQAQLAELDVLKESLFNEMFGDPVRNERGWNAKPLGELCAISRGGSPRPIQDYLGGTIPWIKIGDATSGDDFYLYSTKEYITEAGLAKTRKIAEGSLIFANSGVSLGFARIVRFSGCIHDGWLALENIDESLDKLFLLTSLNYCTAYFRKTAPEGTQPNLNTTIMKNYIQIIPPLDKQREYIRIVLRIEAVKTAVRAGIAETQTLFDALTQKYFG